MLRSTTCALLFVFSFGCIGTETGNPVKPMIDASRIELVMRDSSYEIVGEAGAVVGSGEVAGFEVWSEEDPQRSPITMDAGFRFEFADSIPPFRVFAENEAGRTELLALGIETFIENFSCFRYDGPYDYDLGDVPAAEGETTVLSLSFVNECAVPATFPGARLRLSGDGLDVVTSSSEVASGSSLDIAIVADETTDTFDNIFLVSGQAVGSISFRGRILR